MAEKPKSESDQDELFSHSCKTKHGLEFQRRRRQEKLSSFKESEAFTKERKDSNSFPFQNKKTILKFSVETFWLLVTLEILFCCSFPEEVSDSTKFDAD